MYLSICPAFHHRNRHTEFPLGAVTCATCGSLYAPIHEADVRFALLRDWATSEGVAFDDDGPIEVADAQRFEEFLAHGYWFVKVVSPAVTSGDDQFEFTCIRRQDPHAYMDTVLAEDVERIREDSNGVASIETTRDNNTYTLTSTFIDPFEKQYDTYFLFHGFEEAYS